MTERLTADYPVKLRRIVPFSRDLRLEAVIHITGGTEAENPYSREEFKEYYEVSGLTSVSNATFERLMGHMLPDLMKLMPNNSVCFRKIRK